MNNNVRQNDLDFENASVIRDNCFGIATILFGIVVSDDCKVY